MDRVSFNIVLFKKYRTPFVGWLIVGKLSAGKLMQKPWVANVKGLDDEHNGLRSWLCGLKYKK